MTVRTPKFGDGAGYARYYRENRDFLQPFSPTFEDAMFTDREWEASIPIIHQQFVAGNSIRFVLDMGGRIVGVANLTHLSRSPSYSATLGYTLDEKLQGKGLMREALEAVIEYTFRSRNFHRIRADYMPRNERSGRLLRHLGFQVEGYARDHLLINGQWEDHIMTSLMNPDWRF